MGSGNTSWTKKPWKEDEFCQGSGIICVGTIVEMRFHTVTSKQDIVRYIVCIIDIKEGGYANKLEKDKFGFEVIPSLPDNKSRNALTFDKLAQVIGQNGLPVPVDLLSASQLNQLHPKKKGRFEFWGDVDKIKKELLNAADEVRIITEGDGIFIKKIQKTSVGSFSHLDGGEVMNQVSKKSDSIKSNEKLPQDELEGVDDDEWSD